MRVVMVSKALVVGMYQSKLEALARCPEMDLHVIVPSYWRSDDGGIQKLDRVFTNGYDLIETSMKFNGNFHLHYYPEMKKLLKKLQPDILHMDEEPYNFATWHALRIAKKLRISSLFFTWQNLYRSYPWPFSMFEQQSYRMASCAIAGNLAARDVLHKKGFKKQIHVIPQFGVEPEHFISQQSPRNNGEFHIGYMGRIIEAKGLATLVEAFAMLPSQCRLILIGQGPYKDYLVQMVQQLHIDDRVIFQPPVPSTEVPDMISKLDVLVLPSLTRSNWMEQFGRVLVEAMICKVPVIGSSSGEIPNVIGNAGLIFNEGNASDLAQKILLLINNPEQRTDLAERGRERVLNVYTQERIARQTYEVYQKMLEYQ